MATTNFTDRTGSVAGTTVVASWLNDIDYLMYSVFPAFASDGAIGADGTILVSDGSNYVEESGATARASLGLTIGTDVSAVLVAGTDYAAPGANSDITSLSGLSTPLSVAQGGTGAITHTSGELLVGQGTSAVTSVDPSLYGFTTGDVKITYKNAADTGWVLLDDGTIGNASSGGTTRANADTSDLFTLLWDNISDSYCAVSGGRGASASADFAANKTIALPKHLGRMLLGYGTGSGLSARAFGETGGSEDAIIVSHTHSHSLSASSNGAHTHTTANVSGVGGSSGYSLSTSSAPAGSSTTSSNGAHTHSLTGSITSAGSSGTGANMTPWIATNFMIKL